MKMPNHPHERKRIVLRLMPEQAADPPAVLDALRAALREQTGATLETRSSPADPAVPGEAKRVVLGHLQAVSFDHAAAVLRERLRPGLTPAEAMRAFLVRNVTYAVTVRE